MHAFFKWRLLSGQMSVCSLICVFPMSIGMSTTIEENGYQFLRGVKRKIGVSAITEGIRGSMGKKTARLKSGRDEGKEEEVKCWCVGMVARKEWEVEIKYKKRPFVFLMSPALSFFFFLSFPFIPHSPLDYPLLCSFGSTRSPSHFLFLIHLHSLSFTFSFSVHLCEQIIPTSDTLLSSYHYLLLQEKK